jgi:benzoyl-CoA-dihydrodiol lyase
VDKRKVRRDLADVFCTTAEGVRADRAKEWKLVDHIAKPQQFADAVKARALELAKLSDRPGGAGVPLPPLHTSLVDVNVDAAARTAEIIVNGPTREQVPVQRSAEWYPLQLARELDAAILNLRHNHLDVGLWVLKTRGSVEDALALDAVLEKNAGDWFVRETIGYLRRTLARLDVSSRSIFAVVETGSCFAGTLAELLFAADRSFMLDAKDGPAVALSPLNFGTYPMVNGATRIEARFCEDPAPVEAARQVAGQKLDAHDARALGLVTYTPDDIDWEEEVRIAREERVALSPDALTGMEASLRFTGRENMLTRVFGRLSAWQNWIFIRPNAVGPSGALKVYGTGAPVKYDWERV